MPPTSNEITDRPIWEFNRKKDICIKIRNIKEDLYVAFNLLYMWQLFMKSWVHRCGRVVARAPVTQRACVRSPVGRNFLGEAFFRGFSSPVRQMSGSFRPTRSPNIIWPSLSSSLIIHYGRQWPEILTRPKTSNIHTYIHEIITDSLILIRWNEFN